MPTPHPEDHEVRKARREKTKHLVITLVGGVAAAIAVWYGALTTFRVNLPIWVLILIGAGLVLLSEGLRFVQRRLLRGLTR